MDMNTINNRIKKMKQKWKKGSFLLVALGVCMMAISFFGFAYDVARVMYYKSYIRNLASVMALSIANECSYTYHDSVNGALSVIVPDAAARPKDYKGKYYANQAYVKVLYDLNKKGMDKTCHIDPVKDIILNPYYSSNGTILPSTNRKRFDIGSDGLNGEVEVHITARVDLLFLKTFYKKQAIIRASAIAQPLGNATSSSVRIRDEQRIVFEWWRWDD